MRLLVAPVLLLLGAGTAIATVALHERWWGLPLAAAATVLTLVALPAGWWSRLSFALGWTGVLGVLASPRPDGGWTIGRDSAGYALLALGLLVLAAGLGTLPRRTPTR